MRTDGVRCRESAGTGPVHLKVAPNECCLGGSPWTNQYSPLFPTSTICMKWACMLKVLNYIDYVAGCTVRLLSEEGAK